MQLFYIIFIEPEKVILEVPVINWKCQKGALISNTMIRLKVMAVRDQASYLPCHVIMRGRQGRVRVVDRRRVGLISHSMKHHAYGVAVTVVLSRGEEAMMS